MTTSFYNNLFESYGIEKPSFWNGFLGAVNFFSNNRNYKPNKNTDKKALLSDWQEVAENLKDAMKTYEEESKISAKQGK